MRSFPDRVGAQVGDSSPCRTGKIDRSTSADGNVVVFKSVSNLLYARRNQLTGFAAQVPACVAGKPKAMEFATVANEADSGRLCFVVSSRPSLGVPGVHFCSRLQAATEPA